MTHLRVNNHMPIISGGVRGRGVVPLVFCALLTVALFWPLTGYAATASLVPMARLQETLLASQTLAVIRAGGADLYDAVGQAIGKLPAGAALDVTGRSSDSQWYYGSDRNGATGWVSVTQIVIFDADSLPARTDFRPPALDGTGIDTTKNVSATQATASGETSRQTISANATEPINVRAGPGTGYAIVGTLKPGITVTAQARNEPADWLQIDRGNLGQLHQQRAQVWRTTRCRPTYRAPHRAGCNRLALVRRRREPT